MFFLYRHKFFFGAFFLSVSIATLTFTSSLFFIFTPIILYIMIISNFYHVNNLIITQYFLFVPFKQISIIDITRIRKVYLIRTNVVTTIEIRKKMDDCSYEVLLKNGKSCNVGSYYHINQQKITLGEYLIEKYHLPVEIVKKISTEDR